MHCIFLEIVKEVGTVKSDIHLMTMYVSSVGCRISCKWAIVVSQSGSDLFSPLLYNKMQV